MGVRPVSTVRRVGDRVHPRFLGFGAFGTVEEVASARRASARVRDDMVRLVHRTTGVDRFARDVMRVLEPAVPFDAAGLMTVDPATLLPTGLAGVSNGVDLDVSPRFIEIELREPDYNKFSALARQGRRAASLSAATRGHLEMSIRYRELCRPLGFGDEMRVVCSDSTGAWGDLILARESGRRCFDASEVDFISSLAPLVADGLRRAAILGHVATGDERATGIVVLAPDNSIASATPGLSVCSLISPPVTHSVRICRLSCLPWQRRRDTSATSLGPARSRKRAFLPHKGIG